jgi:hypothetical protein
VLLKEPPEKTTNERNPMKKTRDYIHHYRGLLVRRG